jgi:hypothetical protein
MYDRYNGLFWEVMIYTYTALSSYNEIILYDKNNSF